MTRMSVSLDKALLEETQQALGASTKSETLRIALTETLRRRRLAGVLENMGKIELDIDVPTLIHLREQG